ncbi:endonuclease domain-containing protein [Tamlana haliotis]|uniref:Endonuclease domain-containing protein n=1 Tax=Pseudotamlana haliotis TaxID=2614804 RepID=A0A6N6MCB0_9FLAO|nr:endonuclease domain-containing protein [Tamlana haliotis]KAB1067846.1 endonuclease domain-containing protein [Tamlana haliotis]
MRNKIIPYHPKLKNYARELRKNSTKPEIVLWQKIKRRAFGVQFHRQVPMLNYIVDFYCHEFRLAIEVDGSSHNHKVLYDAKRQQELEAYCVTFLRFSNAEVMQEMFSVLLVIEERVELLRGEYS